MDCLSSLATKLHWRYEQARDSNDLSRAILYDEEALVATPEDERAAFSSDLENRLDLKYQEAISFANGVLGEIAQTHPERSALLSFLGNTFFSKYQRTKDMGDLQQAI